MKIPIFIGVSGVVGALLAGQAESLLDRHTKQLQTANNLSVEYTVQHLPGGPVEYKLKLGRPGRFRLESADEVIVADGSSIYDYKKADNSYTQSAESADDIKKLMKKDAVLPWVAFFLKEPFKDASSIKVGAKRTIKGKA